MQRCLILIDGSNLYFKLKDLKLHNLLEFNFDKFSEFIARSEKVVGRKYYVGRVRQNGSAHADKMLADQQKLFEALKRHNFRYELGFLLKSGGDYHEKGVVVEYIGFSHKPSVAMVRFCS